MIFIPFKIIIPIEFPLHSSIHSSIYPIETSHISFPFSSRFTNRINYVYGVLLLLDSRMIRF
jgi:hypothetical protein